MATLYSATGADSLGISGGIVQAEKEEKGKVARECKEVKTVEGKEASEDGFQ